MLGFVEDLIAARLAVAQGKAPSVTVSIPADHPKAATILKVAKALMIPKKTIRASGLQLTTGIAIPDNADKFLDALREELGGELMGEIEGDLLGQIRIKQTKVAQDLSDDFLRDGSSQGSVMDEVLCGGLLQNALSGSSITKMGNMAQELLRKGPEGFSLGGP